MREWKEITPYLEISIEKGSARVSTNRLDCFDGFPCVASHPPVFRFRILQYQEQSAFLQTLVSFGNAERLVELIQNTISEYKKAIESAEKELKEIKQG